MSTPTPAAGSDGPTFFPSSQVSYIDSRHLLASSAAASTQHQGQDAEGQALIRQLQQ